MWVDGAHYKMGAGGRGRWQKECELRVRGLFLVSALTPGWCGLRLSLAHSGQSVSLAIK